MQRRDFLKTGSGLVVSFSLMGATGLAGAQAASAKSMVAAEVDAWLGIGADGRVTVYSGKVDLGTGVRTALAQLVAEELDVDFKQIDMVMGDTLLTLDQGQTAGSLTISNGGGTLRRAAASARQALLATAATRLGADVAQLSVARGIVSAGDKKISYAALMDGKPLNVKLDPKVALKAPSTHKVIGQSIPRVDIPPKLTGQFTYIHDFKLPGMWHARVVRPPGLGATLVSLDESSVAGIAGVKVVRKQDFVAVVAKSEWAVVKAARQLKARQ
jgi:nicotinate dehydrogenase subunit B